MGGVVGCSELAGRVLRQVRKSVDGEAPVQFGGGHTLPLPVWWLLCWWVTSYLKGCRGSRRKPHSVVHQAGSGYAFECRDPLGGAVEGTSIPFLATVLNA
uniref:Uncharacterized protein n=1 Tax=Oryza punctata TaxID=4537 RepID=A0A0E0JLK3_ORYPU